MYYYSCGQLIKKLRKNGGLTQEELADGICSVSTISRIENDRQVPHLKKMEALLQRLGIEKGDNPGPDFGDDACCLIMIVSEKTPEYKEYKN